MLPVIQGFDERDRPDPAIFSACVRCGLCLPHCPTYLETLRETSSPRGRIHLIQAVSEGRLSVTSPGFVGQMYQCLDCRACEDVCPSGVQYGRLVEAARTQIERARPRPLSQRVLRRFVFGVLFDDMRLFRAASRLLWLYQWSGAQWLARRLGILRALGLREAETLLPTLPARFLRPGGQVFAPTWGEQGRPYKRVALFAGCIMSTAFAETDRATARVLAANGCETHIPAGQGCCGALTIHAGEIDRARVLARRTIEAFERLEAKVPFDAIIVNAAGCGAALKEYGHLLREDRQFAGRAAAFSAKVKDITEFLGDLEQRGALNPNMRPLKLTVTYQEACHLAHAQRVSEQPRRLLHAIPGLCLVEMDEAALCCGSAGIYNITEPGMSRRLLARKMQHALATQAEMIVSTNPGCMLQLQAGVRAAGAPVRVAHLVDLLDAAYKTER
ncbi:MAG TPA: heterodisulfide reductase-related iron-sulfur binding cluster [Ktedonobacterales bacterium]|jgi:glycolate oxidase iron-sulfur subunit